MSDANNPYRSPETGASPIAPLTSQGAITDTMLTYLKGASPWLRFVGIVGFIGCGITVLMGIVFFAVGPVMSGIWATVPGMESFGGLFGGVMGIYCLAFGVLYFLPCFFAYNFGTRIRNYIQSGAEQDLEIAFKNNKSLWKFIGIITIISLAFIPVMIIIGIIVGVALAL